MRNFKRNYGFNNLGITGVVKDVDRDYPRLIFLNKYSFNEALNKSVNRDMMIIIHA